MPRKTRKQKMHAGLKTINPVIDTNVKPSDFTSKEFVINDLRKTLALFTLATVIELVLYWRLR